MLTHGRFAAQTLSLAGALALGGCATAGTAATPGTTPHTEPAPASEKPDADAKAQNRAPAPPQPSPPPVPTQQALERMGELPERPAPSPLASAMQTVGVTEVAVTYSSPGKRDRTIWGELVPYDEPWRTGANAPTRVRFENAVTFGDEEVAAGEYSLITVPGESQWEVILNTDPEREGVFGHDKNNDVARVKVEPEEGPGRERMTFLFRNTTETGTELTLEWSGTRVAVPIEVDTDTVITAQIDRAVDATWRVPYNIGRYYMEQEDHEKAVEWLQRSVELQGDWSNHWYLAQALEAAGDKAKAKEHIQEAMEHGEGNAIWERAFKERAEEALEQ